MRYFKARLTEEIKTLTYRIYITDSLYAKQHGKAVSQRYYDIYERMMHPQKEETRTSEEIVSHIRDKISQLKE